MDASQAVPARIERNELDFVIRTVDYLAAFGLGVIPQKGDLIDRTLAGHTHRYRVFSDQQTSAWEWDDPDHVAYRIHARFEGVVS